MILTNNPMAYACMKGCYEFLFFPEASGREILTKARDLVYKGHTLYTHPLSGSVKPNETPYKSVVVSKKAGGLSPEQAEVIANAIIAYDKFVPRARELSEKVKADFQLIDYTLLSGAMDFDAAAGLSTYKHE